MTSVTHFLTSRRAAIALGVLASTALTPVAVASEFPAIIPLSSLDGTNGFRLDGVQKSDESGFTVASAGDLNGDGFTDVVVGAFRVDRHGYDSGSSYVVFGRASGFATTLDLSTLDGSNGFRLDGVAALDYSGYSVADAGDVNGDGFGDLIIGAFGADPHGSRSGSSYVVFGKPSGFPKRLNLLDLNGRNGFRLDGVAEDDFSGVSVASAGDVNGDGFAEVIVGALGADPHGSGSGSSYVVFGKALGFAATIDLSTLDGSNGFRLDGVAASDSSGSTVASAGDVNGDGFGDIIIAARSAPHGSYSGSSYVVFGKPAGFAASIDLSSLDGSNGFRLNGKKRNQSANRMAVASAGDVNGDGFGDLIIGAHRADPHGSSFSGSTYVVFGKGSGFAPATDLSSLDGNTGFRLDGSGAEYSGWGAAGAGDVNGDGFDDIVVGAIWGARSYVVYGKRSKFHKQIYLSTVDGTNGFRLDGSDDETGRSVASVGDVNGDGFGDVVIGAPYASPHGHLEGSSYVVFGRAPDSATARPDRSESGFPRRSD